MGNKLVLVIWCDDKEFFQIVNNNYNFYFKVNYINCLCNKFH